MNCSTADTETTCRMIIIASLRGRIWFFENIIFFQMYVLCILCCIRYNLSERHTDFFNTIKSRAMYVGCIVLVLVETNCLVFNEVKHSHLCNSYTRQANHTPGLSGRVENSRHRMNEMILCLPISSTCDVCVDAVTAH